MYQKCPICNGTGTNIIPLSEMTVPCSVCNGAKIISDVTGLPPVRMNNLEPSEEEKRQSTLRGIEKAMEDINNFQGHFRSKPEEKVFTAKDMTSFAMRFSTVRMIGGTINLLDELGNWIKTQQK